MRLVLRRPNPEAVSADVRLIDTVARVDAGVKRLTAAVLQSQPPPADDADQRG